MAIRVGKSIPADRPVGIVDLDLAVGETTCGQVVALVHSGFSILLVFTDYRKNVRWTRASYGHKEDSLLSIYHDDPRDTLRSTQVIFA